MGMERFGDDVSFFLVSSVLFFLLLHTYVQTRMIYLVLKLS